MRLAIAATVAAVLAWLLLRPAQAGQVAPDLWSGANDSPDEPQQLPTALESIAMTFATQPDPLPPDEAGRNVRAFLDMIAWAEGTNGPEGYRTLFGGDLCMVNAFSKGAKGYG